VSHYFAALFCSIAIMLVAPARGNECASSGYAKEPVCRISMIRLISDPERYDRKLVSFTGVVRFIPDAGVEIYYSNESFQEQQSVEAVYVKSTVIGNFFSDASTGDRVNVIGRFNVAVPSTDAGPHFGNITELLITVRNSGPANL